MKTKQQRKDLAWKEYGKIIDPAYEEYQKIKDPAYEEYQKIKDPAEREYWKKLKEIDNEPDDEPEQIIEHKGHKYKLIEEKNPDKLLDGANIPEDRICSWCKGFAHIIIPNEVKLCSKCYKKYVEEKQK